MWSGTPLEVFLELQDPAALSVMWKTNEVQSMGFSQIEWDSAMSWKNVSADTCVHLEVDSGLLFHLKGTVTCPGHQGFGQHAGLEIAPWRWKGTDAASGSPGDSGSQRVVLTCKGSAHCKLVLFRRSNFRLAFWDAKAADKGAVNTLFLRENNFSWNLPSALHKNS